MPDDLISFKDFSILIIIAVVVGALFGAGMVVLFAY
jgi:hypothetical protein